MTEARDELPRPPGAPEAAPGGAPQQARADGAGAGVEPAVPTVTGDEGEIPGDPETVVPAREVLLAAMREGFAGEEIEPALLERFAHHAWLMLDANRSINLTAITDPKEIAIKHFLDSWRVTRMMSFFGRTVLDLGSGAGFPGLPVALAEPDCRMTLLDATRKRVTFLERVIEELGVPNATAVWGRAEEHMARHTYDVVLARAVSSVRENVRTLRKVRHAVKDYVMLKGASWSREVRAGERESERLGFRLETVWEHELPDGQGKRAILIYRAPGAQGT